MAKVFFTADTHFGHEAILRFCDRPWKSSAKMDKALVRNWNETVCKEDTVYILGDFVWAGPSKLNQVKSLIEKLNGKKILIYGNHDNLSPQQYLDCGLHQTIAPYTNYKDWYLLHDPSLATACPSDSIVISGHVHQFYGKINKGLKNKIIVDVGIDGWDYRPVEYDKILKEINNVKN